MAIRNRSVSAAPRLTSEPPAAPVTPPATPASQTPVNTLTRVFCAPSTPLTGKPLHPEAAELIPDLDSATTLTLELPWTREEYIAGNLRPYNESGGFGICGHWHSATQDVDFERKLLLRELLLSLPPGAYVLPSGCASIDEMDLAPLKVQALLEALGQRQRVDLNSSAFRWDVRQVCSRRCCDATATSLRRHCDATVAPSACRDLAICRLPLL